MQGRPGLVHFPARVSRAKRQARRVALLATATRERRCRPERVVLGLAILAARMLAGVVLDSPAAPTRERAWRAGLAIRAARMPAGAAPDSQAAQMLAQPTQAGATLVAARCRAVAEARCRVAAAQGPGAAGTPVPDADAGLDKRTWQEVPVGLVARLGARAHRAVADKAVADRGAPTRTHPMAPHERFWSRSPRRTRTV